jgi:hypothetical protein
MAAEQEGMTMEGTDGETMRRNLALLGVTVPPERAAAMARDLAALAARLAAATPAFDDAPDDFRRELLR